MPTACANSAWKKPPKSRDIKPVRMTSGWLHVKRKSKIEPLHMLKKPNIKMRLKNWVCPKFNPINLKRNEKKRAGMKDRILL